MTGVHKTRRRWWGARARLITPETIAYHEAGHAVVAYEFSWWVRRGGVRIGVWAHARLRHRESDDTMLANICISLAGLLAEQKFLGVQWRFEEDVIEHVRAVRAGEDEGLRLDPSDLRAIALALLEDEPAGSLSGARRVVTYCQNHTRPAASTSRKATCVFSASGDLWDLPGTARSKRCFTASAN